MEQQSMKIEDFFKAGMKRYVGSPYPNTGAMLELGPGNSPVHNCISLGLPEWDADTDILPFSDNTFDVIHMYHIYTSVLYYLVRSIIAFSRFHLIFSFRIYYT